LYPTDLENKKNFDSCYNYTAKANALVTCAASQAKSTVSSSSKASVIPVGLEPSNYIIRGNRVINPPSIVPTKIVPWIQSKNQYVFFGQYNEQIISLVAEINPTSLAIDHLMTTETSNGSVTDITDDVNTSYYQNGKPRNSVELDGSYTLDKIK
jgi:hypothetical protein